MLHGPPVKPRNGEQLIDEDLRPRGKITVISHNRTFNIPVSVTILIKSKRLIFVQLALYSNLTHMGGYSSGGCIWVARQNSGGT